MNKDMRNDVVERIQESMEELFEESKNAKDIVYMDGSGIEDYEKPGTYNIHLTQLMIRDMRQLRLFSMSKEPKLSDEIKKWADTLEADDIIIRRMVDDRKDRRSISDFPYEENLEVIKDIAKFGSENQFGESPFCQTKEKIKMWAIRFLKINMIAYYIMAQENIETVLLKAGMRGYDEDGNRVYGISEEDEKTVETIIDIEKILLKVFIRMPAESEQVKSVVARIELIEAFARAIAEEDKEILDRMAKAAEI